MRYIIVLTFPTFFKYTICDHHLLPGDPAEVVDETAAVVAGVLVVVGEPEVVPADGFEAVIADEPEVAGALPAKVAPGEQAVVDALLVKVAPGELEVADALAGFVALL